MIDSDYTSPDKEQPTLGNATKGFPIERKQEQQTSQNLRALLQLLTVTQETFEASKGEPWFTKAWAVISGRRGQFTAGAVNNLGRIQKEVITVISEMLEDHIEIKEDILSLLSHIDDNQSEILKVKVLLLKHMEEGSTKRKRRKKRMPKEQGKIEKTTAKRSESAIGDSFQRAPKREKRKKSSSEATRRPQPNSEDEGPVIGGHHEHAEFNDPKETKQREEKMRATDQQGSSPQPIFNVRKDIDVGLLDYFRLTEEEKRLLFSLEYYLAGVDVEKTVEQETRRKKAEWLQTWQQSINAQLQKPIVSNTDDLFRGLREVRQEQLSVPKLGTILLEVSIFSPYFPITKSDNVEKIAMNSETQKEQLRTVCQSSGFSAHILSEARAAYDEALEGIPPSSFWTRVGIVFTAGLLVAVTGGVAAPFIGGLIGSAMGLSGAAAASAGLAFLGGGAIAAGGLGMAGGTAVLIGGGALLGGGMAGSVVTLLSSDRVLILRELAKLEAVAKSFLTMLPDAREAIHAVIERERETRRQMERESTTSQEYEEDSKKRKDTAKSLKFCDRAIERLEEFIKEASL